ncbi:MAG: relaxase/mobilization nuclease domain-containing protein [Streptococcaceae bacterium]|jgi:hypothetical protein|nr:relaxase/mobilization nuclease domain-containing protein [Streptococcaceae bacterium]
MVTVTLPKRTKGTISSSKGLHAAVAYITNPEKTMNYELVSGQNILIPQEAAEEMLVTRVLAVQFSGRVPKNERFAWHVVQSFSPNDKLSPQEINEIGRRTMKELLGEDYEFIVATHVDRDHIHNHIIFNVINRESLRRFQWTNNTLNQVRDISDKISAEYGAIILENQLTNSHTKYQDYLAQNSYRQEIKNRLNFLMKHSKNWSDFKSKARELDLSINDSGKYITYRLLGSEQKRNIRDRSLDKKGRFLRVNLEEILTKNGATYSLDEIKSEYAKQSSSRENQKEIEMIIENWQVKSATGKYLLVNVDFGLGQQGTIRIPATKVDALENGYFKLFIKKRDKFFFVNSDGKARSRFMTGLVLTKQLENDNGVIPIYSNNQTIRLKQIISDIEFLTSRGVGFDNGKSYLNLTENLQQDLDDTEAALDVLDERIVELEVASQNDSSNLTQREIEGLIIERDELVATYQQVLNDVRKYQKIDETVEQRKEQKDEEKGFSI